MVSRATTVDPSMMCLSGAGNEAESTAALAETLIATGYCAAGRFHRLPRLLLFSSLPSSFCELNLL